MRYPAAAAAGREDTRKRFTWEAERFEQERRVKFNVGLQWSIRLLVRQQLQGCRLDGTGKLQAFWIDLVGTGQRLDSSLQCVGAGVPYAVDAMSEPHEALTTRERVL